jgi:hypothetical protein
LRVSVLNDTVPDAEVFSRVAARRIGNADTDDCSSIVYVRVAVGSRVWCSREPDSLRYKIVQVLNRFKRVVLVVRNVHGTLPDVHRVFVPTVLAIFVGVDQPAERSGGTRDDC